MSVKKRDTIDFIEDFKKNPDLMHKKFLKDQLPVKVSTALLEIAQPLVEKTDMSNKKLAERVIKKAVEVWNISIVIERACASDSASNNYLYKRAMAMVAMQNLKTKINRADYLKLLERKETLYPGYNHFIIDYNIKWSDNDTMMHVGVVTGDADNVTLKK